MRMDKSTYTGKVLESMASGGKPRVKPKKTWMDGIDKVIEDCGQGVKKAKMGRHECELEKIM